MLLVTHIDTYESLDEDIQFKIDNGLGLWTSKNDSELWLTFPAASNGRECR